MSSGINRVVYDITSNHQVLLNWNNEIKNKKILNKNKKKLFV